MIRDVDKQSLNRRFGRPKLKKVKVIDEISVRKGHKNLTLVMDSVEPFGERAER